MSLSWLSSRARTALLYQAIALALACPSRAFAQPPPGDAAARSPQQAAKPVRLVLFTDDATVDIHALRDAIERQSGAPTILDGGDVRGTVTVAYRPSRGELVVSYDALDRASVARVVAAPQPNEVVRLASALASNLVRDEASELLPPGVPAPPPPSQRAPVADVQVAQPGKPEAPLPSAAAAATPRTLGPPTAGASVFYPLATNYGQPTRDMFVQFNLFHGSAGRVEGLQMGLINVAAGRVRGLQLGHLLLGGANIASDGVSGAQLGVANVITHGDLEGAQLGGAVNWTEQRATGLVLGAFNRAEKMYGAAIGGANLSGVDGAGLQIGGVNVAGAWDGLQAGLVNIGTRVRGAQVGLINVADDIEGVPVGLISVTRSGGVHPTVWGSTSTLMNVGLRFRTRYTFTMVSASFHPVDDHWVMGPGFTVGARIPLGTRASFELDGGLTYLNGGAIILRRASGVKPDYFQTRLRVSVAYEMLPRLTGYLGAGGVLVTMFPDERRDPTWSVQPEAFAGVEF
jgi:hypothetical protein